MRLRPEVDVPANEAWEDRRLRRSSARVCELDLEWSVNNPNTDQLWWEERIGRSATRARRKIDGDLALVFQASRIRWSEEVALRNTPARVGEVDLEWSIRIDLDMCRRRELWLRLTTERRSQIDLQRTVRINLNMGWWSQERLRRTPARVGEMNRNRAIRVDLNVRWWCKEWLRNSTSRVREMNCDWSVRVNLNVGRRREEWLRYWSATEYEIDLRTEVENNLDLGDDSRRLKSRHRWWRRNPDEQDSRSEVRDSRTNDGWRVEA